jgi:hypothetical protein
LKNVRIRGSVLTMSSKSSIKKNRLVARIEQEGFEMVVPCTRCANLKKVCIKSEGSDRCSNCASCPGVKCVESKATFSDREWRRIVAFQDQLRAQEVAVQDQIAELLARQRRIRAQENLLRKRAGDFIARDIKEIEELEELERLEEEEKRKEAEQEKAKQAEQEQQELIAAMLNDPTVGDLSGVDFSAFSFPNQLSNDIPESYRGSSSS